MGHGRHSSPAPGPPPEPERPGRAGPDGPDSPAPGPPACARHGARIDSAAMRIGVTLPLADGDTADGHVPDVRRDGSPSPGTPRPSASTRSGSSTTSLVPVPGRARGRRPRGLDDPRRARPASCPGSSSARSSCARRSGTRPSWRRWPATLDDLSGGRVILGPRLGLARPRVRGLRLPDRPQGRAVRGGPRDRGPAPRAASASRSTVSWRQLRRRRPPAAAGSATSPILVAAKGERMLGLTARWADAWNTAWFGRVDDRLRTRPGGSRRRLRRGRTGPGHASAGPSGSASTSPARGRRTRPASTPARPAWPTSSTSSPALGIDDALVWSIAEDPRRPRPDRRGADGPSGPFCLRPSAPGRPGVARLPCPGEDPGSRRQVPARSPRDCRSPRGRSPGRRPRPGPPRSSSSPTRRTRPARSSSRPRSSSAAAARPAA